MIPYLLKDPVPAHYQYSRQGRTGVGVSTGTSTYTR